MKSFKNAFRELARDERGGETMEYALILGLISIVAIAVIGSVGTKVFRAFELCEQRHVIRTFTRL